MAFIIRYQQATGGEPWPVGGDLYTLAVGQLLLLCVEVYFTKQMWKGLETALKCKTG